MSALLASRALFNGGEGERYGPAISVPVRGVWEEMAAFPGFREFTLVKADGTALGRIMLAEPVVDDPMIERMWKILDAQDPIKKLAIV